MDWTQSVDLYCERTDPTFWSEPLNTISNCIFLLAALLLIRSTRVGGGALPWDAAVLATLIALVGIASLLFHTLATVWAGWLDVLFILIFIYVFLARFLARVVGVGVVGTAIGLVLYWAAAKLLTSSFPPDSLNGSYSYLPPLLTLVGLAGFAKWIAHPIAGRLALAALVFAISLVFRTVDQSACTVWPLGTHFIWHCLNSVVLYVAARALFIARPTSGAN